MMRQYRFGPFHLDGTQRVLMRGGELMPLAPKVLETLLVLVENHHRVVSKEELMQALWPHTTVVERSLTQNIFLLRKALGDGYVETLPKRGYRFVSPVKVVAASRRRLLRWAVPAAVMAAAIVILFLRPGGGSKSLHKAPRSTEAYQLYLRGRVQYWDQQSPAAVRSSIELFERAITKDPNFAPAWAGLADCYTNGVFNGPALPYREAIPKARAAARRAVELDDGLAEAHAVLAAVKFRYDWDWPGAEREFKRALQIDPASAMSHIQYSVYLIAMGRFAEGIVESNRARDLDPLSFFIQLVRGWNLAMAGRYDEAIAQYESILKKDPHYAVAHQYLSWAYRDRGSQDQAIAEYLGWMAAAGQNPGHISSLRNAYRDSGVDGYYTKMAEIRHAAGLPAISSLARLGDKNRAFVDLERKFAERDPTMPFLKVARQFDPLRSDPRFAALLQRMALN